MPADHDGDQHDEDEERDEEPDDEQEHRRIATSACANASVHEIWRTV